MTAISRLLAQSVLSILVLAACGDDETGAGGSAAGGGGEGGGSTSSVSASSNSSNSSSSSGAATSGASTSSGDQGGAGGTGSGGGANDSDQQSVGPEGATLTAGGATVTVPADALTETITIGVARLDEAAIADLPEIDLVGMTSASLSEHVFALTPHGTLFQQAVTIELPAFEGATILRLDDESDTTWEIVPATILDGQALVTTYGFSIYGVADVDGTPGCDPVACEATPDDEFTQDYACVFMSESFGEPAGPGFWRCTEACTVDEECSFTFEPYCVSETSLADVAAYYCGIPGGQVSGGCNGLIGAGECHGTDGQNPDVTLCVDGACTDTPA